MSVAEWLTGADREVAWRGDQPLMLGAMRRQVQALSLRLAAQPGTHWGLCFDDSYRFCVALLACWYASKTPVMPGHSRAALLNEMQEQLDGVLCDMPLAVSLPLLTWDEAEAQGQLPPLPASSALILFTSGSTGTPRQVMKSLTVMEQESRWLSALWGEQLQGCRVIASVSHQHLYGLSFRLFLPMTLRLPFSAQPLFYGEQLAQLPRDCRYAFISSPAFLSRLDSTLDAPGCELIVSAGGTLRGPDAEQVWQRFGCPVSEIYGSTETGILAWRQCDRADAPWRSFSGVRLEQVTPERWQVWSPLIAGDNGLALDDRLNMQPDGGFQLAGRHDRIVKIGDKRISLSEIERRLTDLPEIDDAVALVVTRHDRQAIGVVLSLTSTLDEAALHQHRQQWKRQLQCWLEPLAMPRYWRIVATIPVTPQSKRAWPQIEELFHVAD
ncbi:acyl-CoA synthetase [Pantoea sp. PNT01]|uniref:Acyl-CoA synthetase n=1 Tax=Pantoea eucalypti TaxID=470933 RepID=A0ABY2ZLY1_9GAMM|nr:MULTISPECIES: AMP-binding protein [Pantoea]PQL28491.1 AMP-binding protein [Pantoea ananatis]TPD96515.1 acyl-CoA synthetase [Pantoea vagans]MBD9550788.1 acyl-CoA synthetase [Pantoea sp. PNT01]MCD2356697.1 AMP-binding protein [Pantoea sp. MHSD4]QGF27580.1 AMP-binding protein [Pantoea eucalypti]